MSLLFLSEIANRSVAVISKTLVNFSRVLALAKPFPVSIRLSDLTSIQRSSANPCIVKNGAKHLTDIYPVRFQDGIIEPATAAARYVLRTAK